MSPRRLLVFVFALSIAGQAQTNSTTRTVVVAGSGYRLDGPSQQAAPGQVMLISVFGIKTVIPGPTLAVPTSEGLPKSLLGITVDLVQDKTVTPVDLRAIQQAYCAVEEACSTVTQITLHLPFSLQAGPPTPYLRISENGTAVGAVMLTAVSDRIHVLNTCDATLIQVGAASSAPPDVCTPAVMVNQKLNSLYNLVRGGDVVGAWAFGLGNLAALTVVTGLPPVPNIQLNFDFRPNAPASPPVAGFGITATPIYYGYTGGGLYQVNFAIPPVPSGLPACDGNKITSNLTVTIAGKNSNDAAKLCVAVE
jgi:hypothetical protein